MFPETILLVFGFGREDFKHWIISSWSNFRFLVMQSFDNTIDFIFHIAQEQ